MIIGIDFDGVIADLQTHWLNLYNRDFDDNLTSASIRDWDMSKYTKCTYDQLKQYLFLDGLYDGVLPIPGAKEAIAKFRDDGYTVLFISDCARNHFDQKIAWLVSHGFCRTESQARKEFIGTAQKNLIAANMLIDDKMDNIRSFANSGAGKEAVVFTQPWNDTAWWTEGLRMNNWSDAQTVLHNVWEKIFVYAR